MIRYPSNRLAASGRGLTVPKPSSPSVPVPSWPGKPANDNKPWHMPGKPPGIGLPANDNFPPRSPKQAKWLRKFSRGFLALDIALLLYELWGARNAGYAIPGGTTCSCGTGGRIQQWFGGNAGSCVGINCGPLTCQAYTPIACPACNCAVFSQPMTCLGVERSLITGQACWPSSAQTPRSATWPRYPNWGVPWPSWWPGVDPEVIPPMVPLPTPMPVPYPRIPDVPWNDPERVPGNRPEHGPLPSWEPSPFPHEFPNPNPPGRYDPFPRPHPQPDPYPTPDPREDPRKDPRNRPSPRPDPFPRPNPEPFPKPGPRFEPKPGTVTEIAPSPSPRPVGPTPPRRPPKPGEKERKFTPEYHGLRGSWPARLAEMGTEAADMVGCLYRSLPKKRQTARNFRQKLRQIYRFFDEANVADALGNCMTSQGLDRFWALQGKALGKGALKNLQTRTSRFRHPPLLTFVPY